MFVGVVNVFINSSTSTTLGSQMQLRIECRHFLSPSGSAPALDSMEHVEWKVAHGGLTHCHPHPTKLVLLPPWPLSCPFSIVFLSPFPLSTQLSPPDKTLTKYSYPFFRSEFFQRSLRTKGLRTEKVKTVTAEPLRRPQCHCSLLHSFRTTGIFLS